MLVRFPQNSMSGGNVWIAAAHASRLAAVAELPMVAVDFHHVGRARVQRDLLRHGGNRERDVVPAPLPVARHVAAAVGIVRHIPIAGFLDAPQRLAQRDDMPVLGGVREVVYPEVLPKTDDDDALPVLRGAVILCVEQLVPNLVSAVGEVGDDDIDNLTAAHREKPLDVLPDKRLRHLRTNHADVVAVQGVAFVVELTRAGERKALTREPAEHDVEIVG